MSELFDTLVLLSKFERINLWIYKKIKPYLGQRILEAGCGNGNLISYFLDRELVLAVDSNDKMLEASINKWFRYQNLKFIKCDLENFSIPEISKYGIDTIICINTLEHIKDDIAALNNFNAVMKDGNLVLLVPAFKSLYCSLDKAFGHYRRYEMQEISDTMERCGFRIIKKMYFNFWGIIGWFINGKVFKKDTLSRRLLWLYNFLSPILILFEKLSGPPVGLSIILICKKIHKS